MADNSERSRIDRLYSVMCNRRRRQIVAFIHNSDRESFQLDELVAELSCPEEDLPQSAVEHRTRTRLSLHHQDLPKLAGAGLVDYDHRTGDIRYRATSEVGDLLDLIDTTGESTDHIGQYL